MVVIQSSPQQSGPGLPVTCLAPVQFGGSDVIPASKVGKSKTDLDYGQEEDWKLFSDAITFRFGKNAKNPPEAPPEEDKAGSESSEEGFAGGDLKFDAGGAFVSSRDAAVRDMLLRRLKGAQADVALAQDEGEIARQVIETRQEMPLGIDLSELQMRLQGMRGRFQQLKEENRGLLVENQQMAVHLEELEQQQRRDTIDAVRFQLRPSLISDKQLREQERKMQLKEEIARLRGLRVNDIDEEDIDLDAGLDHDQSAFWRLRTTIRRRFHRVSRWVRDHRPLEDDVHFIESRFGTGIASYFTFGQWLFLCSGVLSLLWLGVFIFHISLLAVQGRPFTFSNATLFFLPGWLNFSSFGSSEARLYTIFLLIGLGFLIIASFAKMVNEARRKRRVDIEEDYVDTKRIAKLVFRGWDHSSTTKREVEDARYALSSQLAVLMTETSQQQEMKKRTRDDRVRLYVRRGVSMVLVSLFVLFGLVAIILVTLNQKGIASFIQLPQSEPFLQPVIVSALTLVLPIFLQIASKFERWDTPATEMKLMITRLYVSRFLNMLIIMLTYFQVLNPGTVPIATSSTTTGANTATTCREDVAGAGIFTLFVFDFFLRMLTNLFTAAMQRIGSRIWGLAPRREFNLPQVVVDILYLHGLVWMAIPYFPSIAVFGAIAVFARIKWNLFLLRNNIFGKPQIPWRAKDIVSYFVVFYMTTFVTLCLAGHIFFLVIHQTGACGPFESGQSGLAPLERDFSSGPLWFIGQVVLSPIFLYAISIYLLYKYFVQRSFIETLREYLVGVHVDYRRAVSSLERDVQKLKKQRS